MSIGQFEVRIRTSADSFLWQGKSESSITNKSGYLKLPRYAPEQPKQLPVQMRQVLAAFRDGKKLACRGLHVENNILFFRSWPVMHKGDFYWTMATDLNMKGVEGIIEYVTGYTVMRNTKTGALLMDGIPCEGKKLRIKTQ